MVVHLPRNLLDSRRRNPRPLFERQRVIRFLKLDVRPKANSTGVNCRLRMERFGITGNRIAEPAEVCGFVDSVRLVPKVCRTVEIRLAQRHPNAPSEWAFAVEDGYFYETTNEEVYFVDDTLIGIEFSPTLALVRWN